ncbi:MULTISPECIES: GlxA family transcriptional regulator [unclassified Rhizobium]|uniref:GlxA family transcriptional regulator n=1 Tax=Hyphomicrobiales TaxID=356 RepID=UPI000FF0788A|nr:helix-turn-helix domain-containing protein [Rhizobium sp. WW_1]RKD74086.1 AraC family carnitine catabolism transcriptional activator [Rhizobium sp. WW_1]
MQHAPKLDSPLVYDSVRPRHRACIIVADGFNLFSFTAVLEALRIANQCSSEPAYGWWVMSLNSADVVSDAGVKIAADSTFLHRSGEGRGNFFESVYVISSSVSPQTSKLLGRFLNKERTLGARIVGIERGVFELARAGLVTEAALHWGHASEFLAEFGAAVPARWELFVENQDVATCAGGSAVVDMMAHLVGSAGGQAVAAHFCQAAIVERVRPSGELQSRPFASRHPASHPTVVAAIKLMETHVLPMLTLKEIAFNVGISRRQLERLFQTHAQCTPARYYQSVRLELSRYLLSSKNIPIGEIASQCGFISSSHFSRAYFEHFGLNPRATRLRSLGYAEFPHQGVTNARISTL